jgi:hypothetical protein
VRLLLWLWLALAASAHAAERFDSVQLSEIVADNQRGLRDEDGERSGWIELHHGGRTPVNLAGWFLTDNRTNRTRWRLPAVSLLPDKYLVVFASGKDRTNDLAHLHANFRLDPHGGYLALLDRATNLVSEFASYPSLAPDESHGAVRGEPSVRGRFGRPTPGRPNATSGPGFAPEVLFSRSSGNFPAPFPLELKTATTGAVIHFTQDGTLPTRTSPEYVAPLLITNTAQIRARAFQDGLLPGPPHSESYLRLFSNVWNFTSTLPVLVLDTFGQDAPVSGNLSFVHVSVHEPVAGVTSLTNPPVLTTRAGFRLRGSSSQGMPQSSFAVDFLDEFNQEQAAPLVGLPADSEWILYAPNAYDPGMIHNPFIHQLSRDLGRYSPRTRFVEVFLMRKAGRLRESHYQGVYVLQEKIKISKHRVDIDRLGADELKPPQVTGGYILKFDRLGPGELGLNSSGDRGMVFVEPKEPVMLLPQRAPQREYLVTFFRNFERALNGPNWRDPATGYRAYLDVDAAIDFHVLEVLSGNVDALVLSTYFHKPRGGRIIFGPHWDFDRALGSVDERDANPRVWSTGPFFGGEWWPRLFSDPDFWQQWVDRWQEWRVTYFSLTNLNRLIDSLAGEVREAQPREYARWGLQPHGGTFENEISHMKDWLSNRIDFIDAQLVPPPRIQRERGSDPAGSLLSLAAPPAAEVYYTLDGSDPRLPQGGIASNAVVYHGPIEARTNTWLVARARNSKRRQTGGPPVSTPWSRRVEARFPSNPPK